MLEVLADSGLEIDKVIISESARGAGATAIRRAAKQRRVLVQTASAQRVKALAGNGKQDQGVLADVVAPGMAPLDGALAAEEPPERVLLVDGITTPANLGMIVRTATAAGIGGIVVPRKGVASLDPLVIKASAGVAFHAPLLRCATATDAARTLLEAGYPLYALHADASSSVFDTSLPTRSAFVFGGESAGLSPAVADIITSWLRIPMQGSVDSLNVSAAAAVLCFELARRTGGIHSDSPT